MQPEGYVFIFAIQGILQSLQAILRTTKKQQKKKQPEWACFNLCHLEYPSKPAGHFTNHKGKQNTKRRVQVNHRIILRTKKEKKKTKRRAWVCFRLCNSKYQSNPTGYFEKPQRNNRRQCGRKDMFLSLPYKVFFKACKSFHEPQRNKRRQSSRNGHVFIFTIQGIL